MARLSGDDRRVYGEALRAIAPLSDAELAAGLALARPRELERGQCFLRSGAAATEVAVVVRGLLREHFVMADGAERTKAFVAEGQLSGSLADLLSGAPSRAFIVADEPTRLLVTPYVELRELSRSSPAWSALARAALEGLLLRKANREWELLGLDAEQRYAAFRAQHPQLESRVLARHVASYLGITAAHLSRLRRRRAKRVSR